MKKKRRPQRTYCPLHEDPIPGARAKVCWRCEIPHSERQEHVKLIDGRTLAIGGKVQPKPGCE